MKRRTIVASVLVVLAATAAGAVLLGCGSSDSSNADPYAKRQNYEQKQFAVAIVNGWPVDEEDRRVGAYLESSWHYSPTATFTVYSRTADETGSPMAAAELARVQTRKLPDYDEGDLGEIKLRGIPVVRWSFDLGDARYVEYFFEECGISLISRATSRPRDWQELSSYFRDITESITANCDA